mmetsp:Transcript_20795/g.47818  ORF Transcript_20795/g.47818 Transcript_20795/m.47818 type:complete len:155 (+) Transcript_20795:86-550(+)
MAFAAEEMPTTAAAAAAENPPTKLAPVPLGLQQPQQPLRFAQQGQLQHFAFDERLVFDFSKPNTAPTAAAAARQLVAGDGNSDATEGIWSCDDAPRATPVFCAVFTEGLTKARGNAMAKTKQRDTMMVERATIPLVALLIQMCSKASSLNLKGA